MLKQGANSILGQTQTTKKLVYAAFNLKADGPISRKALKQPKRVGTRASFTLGNGQSRSLERMSAVVAGFNANVTPAQAWSKGAAKAKALTAQSFDDALSLHRRYFDQLKQTPIKYHELAATVGGPVMIPKVYDGRNKTFFFMAFQQHNEKASETAITTVPNADMLNGDFSFGGLGLPIYDPTTTRQNATGTWIRDPFPGNRIPTARFDLPSATT